MTPPATGPFHFGSSSEAQLALAHPDLQRVLRMAILYVDFTIVETHRGKAKQNAAVAQGKSQTPWPTSKHNAIPSYAADIMPFPIDWDDNVKAIARVAFLMGVIRVCAQRLSIPIRFGMDWNRNLDPRDEKFLDWDHVELDRPVAPEHMPTSG